MTICIGALCGSQNGQPPKAVVVASDRMATLANITEFEHGVPKLCVLRDKIVALTAGDVLRASNLVRQIIATMPPEAARVTKAAEIAAVKYAVLRDHQIEADVFRPRGLTRDGFYKNAAPAIQGQITFQLDNHLATFNFGVDVIIAGVDDGGASLYQVGNPGALAQDLQPIGFSAIGSGQLHAAQSMIGFGHTPFRSIQETIFSVYASKRRAEVAPGVGKETDFALITGTGIAWFNEQKLAKLSELFQQYQRPAPQNILDEVAKLI